MSAGRHPSPRQLNKNSPEHDAEANRRHADDTMGAVSLTLAEARGRAALVSDVSYDLHFDLTHRETFGVRAVVSFSCNEPGGSTFRDSKDGQEWLPAALPRLRTTGGG